MFWEIGQSENGKKALLNPQTLNSYSYAGNNPVTYSDPDGKFVPLLIGAAYMSAPALITGANIAGGLIASYFVAHDVGTIVGTATSNAPASYKSEVYGGVAGNWGGALSAASQLTSAVAGETRTVTKTTLQMNKTNGAAFEKSFGENLSKTQNLFADQITLKTQSGLKIRADFISKDNLGSFCIFECKSSITAPLTKNQSRAFPEIQQSGATIVGKGKEGFTGGMSIPPTRVNIIRPN